ncbi:MAG: hypothetical protein FAF04_08340, partial [Epsilonproteobacteria bacterium]|nr:hypothetical protein [Campylobacterota bacterium]
MKLKKISIGTYITVAFGLFFIVVASLFIYLSNYYAHKLAHDATKNNFYQLSQSVNAHLDDNYNEIDDLMKILSLDVRSQALVQQDELHPLYPVMKLLFKEHKSFYKMYVLDRNENIFELIALKKMDASRIIFHAPKKADYLAIITVKETTEYLFLDANDKVLQKRKFASTLSVQKEPWYLQAKEQNEMVFTKPYKLSHSKRLGVSFAKKMGENIFCIDMNLASFNNYLARLAPENIRILLYNNELKNVYANSEKLQSLQLPKAVEKIVADKIFNKLLDITIQGKKYYLLITPSSSLNDDLLISYVAQKRIL